MEKLGNRLPSWTAEDTAKTHVYHEPMVRDMFRCGHLERQYKDIDIIGADDTDYATMDKYRQ